MSDITVTYEYYPDHELADWFFAEYWKWSTDGLWRWKICKSSKIEGTEILGHPLTICEGVVGGESPREWVNAKVDSLNKSMKIPLTFESVMPKLSTQEGMNKNENFDYLLATASFLNVEDLVFSLSISPLANEKFKTWSGSSKPEQHHYGKGGLCKHTKEVVKLMRDTATSLGIQGELDPVEMYLAALFHDCGKIWDYEPVDSTMNHWRGTTHKRMIHHISRGAIWWNDCVSEYRTQNPGSTKYDKYEDLVTHAILAHHGRREFGSPVTPKTKVAWLLSLCDGISARMDDANKLDVLHDKE